MFNVGGGEILAILVIALIVLGPDKLPNAARQAGKYLNEFRRISSGFQDEIRGAMDLATTTDPTPVKMDPVQPADTDPSTDVAGGDAGDPGVASETVARAADGALATNGSSPAPAPDPIGGAAPDPSPTTSDDAPSTGIAPSAEVAEAELAVTRAKLAAAQAELAEAEARLAVIRSQRVDPAGATQVEPADDAGSVPPDSARA